VGGLGIAKKKKLYTKADVTKSHEENLTGKNSEKSVQVPLQY